MRVRTETKREAILDIAAKAFIEMGYERASMAEISARVGGSKATLYGYFESKEQLFIEVTKAVAKRHMQEAHAELKRAAIDVPEALQRFGEKMVGFLSQPDAMATQRMVIAESGHSDVGQLFYQAGPGLGIATLAAYLQAAMDGGQLRAADPHVAAHHLFALLQAEILPLRLLGMPVSTSRAHVRKIVERGLKVFLAGYGAAISPSV